jgi:transcriptional regulator with XRE-family HTH domain
MPASTRLPHMKEFLKSRQNIIAANIKQVRTDKNLTSAFVALGIKMSLEEYLKLELDQTEFTLNCLFKIAAILDVNILELIENDPLLIQLADNGQMQ